MKGLFWAMGKFRKLYRLSGLIFIFAYLWGDRNIIFGILFFLSLILLAFEILRFKFPEVSQKYFQIFSLIAKKREEKSLLGTTYFVWGMLATVLFFEKEIAVLALLFLVFGDIVSFYAGKIGRILLPWGKTLEASLAVFITCLVIGLIFTGVLGIKLPLAIIFIGALVATLTETLPLKIGRFYLDDNLTIPIFSAAAMTLAKLLI